MKLTYKTVVLPAIAGLACAASIVVAGITATIDNSEIATQEEQIASLSSQVEHIKLTETEAKETVATTSVGGDPARVEADSAKILKLADVAFTWDNEGDYNNARADIMRIYSLTEDSDFMTAFLPTAPYTEDADGNRYSYIDAAELNSAAGGSQIRLLSVRGLTYNYMVLTEVVSSSSDGRGDASNVATMFVTTDGEGAITEVTGYASTEAPRSSN